MANKYLIGGIILLAGVGGYFYLNKKEQQSSPTPAGTPSSGSGPAAASTTSTAPPVTSSSGDAQMRQTLLNWATGTQNVALYQAWINQLSSADLAAMYDILVNDWEGTGRATAAQSAAWNDLVNRFPFLKYAGVKDGVKCSNFNCN